MIGKPQTVSGVVDGYGGDSAALAAEIIRLTEQQDTSDAMREGRSKRGLLKGAEDKLTSIAFNLYRDRGLSGDDEDMTRWDKFKREYLWRATEIVLPYEVFAGIARYAGGEVPQCDMMVGHRYKYLSDEEKAELGSHDDYDIIWTPCDYE